ncbi:MAG: RIP metalloprotease RseP, partial [Burkholderiales bacterium]|nr:RIP metalloprotease RseP [Burkholderiales bacterium]
KMLDEREGPVDPREAHRAFNRQSVWKRIAIVAAGPIANFLLAIAIYWVLLLGGVTEPKAILGAPEAGTVAAAAGVAAGDRVVAVNGEPVATWQSLRWTLLEAALDRKRVRVEVVDAAGHVQWRDLDPGSIGADRIEGDVLGALGLRLYRPAMPAVLGKVIAGGAAERAGLRAGDRIVSVDGVAIDSWDDFVATIRRSPGKPLRIVAAEGGAAREVVVTPEPAGREGERVGRIGAAPQVDREALRELMVEVRYGPVEALGAAAAKTWDMSLFSLRMLWKMVAGDLSWRNLSGPVTIADYAGQAAQVGLAPYLAFIALISISLGVLNLLPIPLLDGGHLMYYFAEVVKGSPVSERAMEVGQRVGLTLLLFLMAFAFYNDINRLLTG